MKKAPTSLADLADVGGGVGGRGSSLGTSLILGSGIKEKDNTERVGARDPDRCSYYRMCSLTIECVLLL